MKTILYTSPVETVNEIETISAIFDAGLNYLYIRKPKLDDFSLVDFVEKIPEKYWKQCVSNSLIITKEFDLGGYHFTRDIMQKNELYNDKVLDRLHSNDKISSVSAHSLDEIKKYSEKFKHVIVSPIFPSLSKESHSYDWDFDEIRMLLTDCHASLAMTEYFAVGGIDINNTDKVKKLNFNGVGLLGAVWNKPEESVNNFRQIFKTLNTND